MAKKSSEGRQTAQSAFGPEYEAFAEIIKKHRKKVGITQWELSERVGRSKSYIGKFESGKAFPDFMTGVEIIRALGLDVNEIVSQVYAQAKKKSR